MGAFPFLGGAFNGRSPSFDAQRTVNLYLEQSESGNSRSPAMLIGTPGLNPWLTLAGGRVRGCIPFSAWLSVVVCGPNVYTVTNNKVATLIGVVDNNSATVSMASNGSMIMLVDGTYGYFIDPNIGSVAQIIDPDFQGGVRVDYVDGYFIWNVPGTAKFQITGLLDTIIDGLDFATAEASPDNLNTLIVDHREVWLLGENSTEVWYDAGNVDFPFQRIQGAFLEIGCAAPQSVAKLDNSIFWLATDDRGFGTIQRAAGYTPQRVSNHAVEFAIASYGTISDAVAYTYSQEGHEFYVISFPSADATWCLDVSNGLWHERAYSNSDGTLGRHRSNCQMNFAGLTIVGDWETANLYSLDLDYFSDNGTAIKRIRVCPHYANDNNFQFFHSLELTMQTGIGLTTGQGSDPQAMLTWSNDGGYSYGNEIWASIGRIGERYARVKWHRLGCARDRVFKVTISDPIRVVMTGCVLSATGGRV